MNLNEFVNSLSAGALDNQLKQLYGSSDKALLKSRARFLNAAERFSRNYPICGDIHVFSVPGMIDLSGSICGKRSGCVLAAASDRDVLAITSLNGEGIIRVSVDGLPEIAFKVSDLRLRGDEQKSFAGLIRAAAAEADKSGISLRGFDMYLTSDITHNCGETAAVSVMLSLVLNTLCAENTADMEEIIAWARAAEGVIFGTVSGIEEYTLCTEGGIVYLDSTVSGESDIRRYDADILLSGYSICETDTGGGEEIPLMNDVSKIAAKLGAETLCEVDSEMFFGELPALRKSFSDGALAKAAGFYAELERLRKAADSLEICDTEGFFAAVGSAMSARGSSLAAQISRRILGENGAVIDDLSGSMLLAFVPNYLAEEYVRGIEYVFGAGACHSGAVRTFAACEITK